MPLTQLDATPALLVIDLQKGIVGMPLAHPAAGIVAHSARLAGAFRSLGLPVVLVNVTGRAPGRTDAAPRPLSFPPDGTELIPELGSHPGDCLISKQRPGAFLGTPLDDFLGARGVTQVILTGIATSGGVESTVRSAYDLGYNVVMVVDAMTDRDTATHDHTVQNVFPRFGETCATSRVLQLLGETRP